MFGILTTESQHIKRFCAAFRLTKTSVWQIYKIIPTLRFIESLEQHIELMLQPFHSNLVFL